MFDMHCDLLTIAYCCYINNDYEMLIRYRDYIKKGNIKNILANLYFMNLDEMNEELGVNYYQGDVLSMFKKARAVLEKYIPDVNFYYSIEGCDYLDISDLKPLKEAGLDSFLIVWNNPNKYGSGIRSNKGLTTLGEKFIKEAIRLNIGIDLSHANRQTFKDIVKIIKENKYPFVFASHSNLRSYFDHPRNLDEQQLTELKQMGGKLGLVAVNYFAKNIDDYVNQIRHAVFLLGIDNVMVSSDNMEFLGIDSKIMLFPYQDFYFKLSSKLKKYYKEEEIEKILYKNSLSLFKERKR